MAKKITSDLKESLEKAIGIINGSEGGQINISISEETEERIETHRSLDAICNVLKCLLEKEKEEINKKQNDK